jgi:hypothetical protein
VSECAADPATGARTVAAPAGAGDHPVTLLAGLALADGDLVTQARVRPLNGDDEEWLAAQPATLATAVVTTGLLARAVVRLGPLAPPPVDALLDLPVADRDVLLLSIRRVTYGDGFDVVLSCPSCGEPMDVSFAASDIPTQPRPTLTSPVVRDLVDGTGATVTVTLRPPTGRDQEAVARAAREDTVQPVEILLRRCLLGVDGGPGGAAGWDLLSPDAREAFAAAVDEVSAAVELALDLTCPECGKDVEADLDLGAYLLGEFTLPAGTVLRDLHLLAAAYHWPERDIMRLPSPRRRALAALVVQDLRRAQELR